MWRKDINFSKIGNSVFFKKCTLLVLSWDKWLDDPRWNATSKWREYISFELPKIANDSGQLMTIEMDDEALLVDKRAFYKATIYIAQLTQGEISEDNIKWLSPQQYAETLEKYLTISFDEAVELSFAEATMKNVN